MLKGFTVNRDVDVGRYRFDEVFSGIEQSPSLKRIFGGEEMLRKALEKTFVQIVPSRMGYMRVRDDDGRIVINRRYLKSADIHILYLDLVHELVHVKQYLDGRELFDERYDYVDRPTEIEAYSTAVEEARRIGMNNDEISEYLKVEWTTEEQHRRLLQKLGIKAG